MKTMKSRIIGFILCCIILLTGMSTYSQATTIGSFSVSKSSATITEGGTTTFNINTTNCEGQFTISSSDSNIVKVSSSSEWVTSSTTITLTAVKSGSATITITATDVADNSAEPQPVTGSKTISVTVKANTTSTSSGTTGSSGSSSSSSSSNTTTATTPTFTSVNKTVYTTSSCNLRASWSTSSTATPIEQGTELTLTGTSTETINGYVWYRVTYNGATKYIASSLITYTKPEEDEKSSNKNLSSLSIEGIELTPAFDKETTQYTAQVDGDVTELKIDAKAEDSKATVTIEGNEGLEEGDNIIKVKVTAEDDTTRTYFITVTKGEGIETDNTLKLSELKIERVNFEETFNPDTYTYELSLNTYVENLEITAIPNQADATVEIIGNSDFKVGTNTVTILLTSADGTQTATYQIQVNLSDEIVAETSEPSMAMYIIIGVVIAVAIIAIFLFILRYRTTKKEEIEDDDMDSKLMSRYTADNEKKEKENEASKSKKSDVTVDDFLNESDENESQGKTKKSKGRHSI